MVRLPHSFFDFFCISNWQPFRLHMARSQSSLIAVLCHRGSGHVRILPSFHDHSYGSCAIVSQLAFTLIDAGKSSLVVPTCSTAIAFQLLGTQPPLRSFSR